MTCQLTFLPVGNADSIVIQDDNSLIVVDLGNLDALEEWLQKHEIFRIDRIYITHAHGDHFPSLIKLVDFLNTQFKRGIVEKFHFPERFIEIARRKILSDRSNPKNQRLELALNDIIDWDNNSTIKSSPIVRNGEEYSEGYLKIQALHPSSIYLQNYIGSGNNKFNEISLVLRVIYGNFSALLLADIEGKGLTALLEFLKKNATGNNFTTNVVKIPHHGAWPSNGNDLSELLALVDAEIAVLSVGSTNQHKHVKPELFKALVDLKSDSFKRLETFVCTEVTRTCVHSASDCASMDKSGLSQRTLCAGEITILADASGKWEKPKTETDHLAVVSSFAFAACEGRAQLD